MFLIRLRIFIISLLVHLLFCLAHGLAPPCVFVSMDPNNWVRKLACIADASYHFVRASAPCSPWVWFKKIGVKFVVCISYTCINVSTLWLDACTFESIAVAALSKTSCFLDADNRRNELSCGSEMELTIISAAMVLGQFWKLLILNSPDIFTISLSIIRACYLVN